MTLTVLEWAEERLANTTRLAALKVGDDRKGWLEDEAYWREIVVALKAKSLAEAAPPAPHQDLPSPLPSRLNALAHEMRTCFRFPVQHGGVDHIFADKADEWADGLAEIVAEMVRPLPPSAPDKESR